MAYLPSIAAPGYAGWKALQRSLARQTEAFGAQPSVKKSLEHFRAAIDKAKEPGDIIKDRRLLSVVLGAFGLESEIDKKAIIRRVMSEGVDDPKSFANRINDQRWRSFAQAFSFARGTPAFTKAFKDAIAARFVERGLESAIGDVDPSMRLALNFRRDIAPIASGPNVERVGWLQIMGSRPLRTVVEGALGLPSSLASIDLERQADILAEKSSALFGDATPRAFLNPENVDTALRRFFEREAASNGPSASAPGAAALVLLQQGGIGPLASAGLVASSFRSG
jgi:hypothetical protein